MGFQVLYGHIVCICDLLHFVIPLDLIRDEAVIFSGHWMAQEKPVEVNRELLRWMFTRVEPHLGKRLFSHN